MASAAFLDGYPFDPTRPDFPIHCILDGELRNCEALRGTPATNGLRYPAYFAASDEEPCRRLPR